MQANFEQIVYNTSKLKHFKCQATDELCSFNLFAKLDLLSFNKFANAFCHLNQDQK